MIRRLASFLKSPVVIWVGGITVVMWVLLLWRPNFTEFMELKLYDLKFRFRGPQAPSSEVVILAIDDDSVKKVGRWPWSRNDLARLIKMVKEAGPKVVALDIIFAEKQETGALKAVTNLRQEFTRKGVTSPDILSLLAQEEQRADVDRQLAKAIKEGPPTILGFYFRGVGWRE